jgi:hypothetical protein
LIPIQVVRTHEEGARKGYGSKGVFEMIEFDGGHEFNGKLAWRFLKEHL